MENNQNCKFNISRSFSFRLMFLLFAPFFRKISFEKCRLLTSRNELREDSVSGHSRRANFCQICDPFQLEPDGADESRETNGQQKLYQIESHPASERRHQITPKRFQFSASFFIHFYFIYKPKFSIFFFLLDSFSVSWSFYGSPCGLKITK